MKVALTFPPLTDVELVKDGDKIVGVKLTPFFNDSSEVSVFAKTEVRSDKGKIGDSFDLVVSGRKGKARMSRGRSTSAVPLFDLDDKERQERQVARKKPKEHDGGEGQREAKTVEGGSSMGKNTGSFARGGSSANAQAAAARP
jgi:hypothetical protein